MIKKRGRKLSNQEWVDKYKADNIIIKTYFTDKNDKIINDIVNPLKIDNRQLCSPTDDQGSTPHCAGYAAAQLAEAVYWKRTGKLINLDAHQIYAKAKEKDQSIDVDGEYCENTLQAAIDLCAFENPESVKVKLCYDNTTNIKEKVKFIIHKYDFMVAGFLITDGWYQCIEGEYNILPGITDLGGHAVVICGYDEDGVYIQNHWGKHWGAKGFGKLSWKLFYKEFIYGAYIANAYDDCK